MNQPEDSAIFKTFHFPNTAAYNDFVLVYNKMDKAHQDFATCQVPDFLSGM